MSLKVATPTFKLFMFCMMLLAACLPVLAYPTGMRRLDSRHEGHDHPETPATTDAGSEGDALVEVVAAGWYPSWFKTSFPPSAVPWEKYSEMYFAFALTTPDPSKLSLEGEEETLRAFVQEAKSHNVSALLSVGGWTGSQFFSPAVATPESRAIFIKALIDMVTEYNLDGLDFDWEFPNADGIGCNQRSPADLANFLAFLQELRADPIGAELLLTAAGHIAPWHDASGVPSTDVSAFAKVLDRLAIMGYDIHGRWSANVGANAPLKASCAASPDGSVEGAVQAWTSAGFPAKQLVLAMPLYGRSFQVAKESVIGADGAITNFAPAFNKEAYPLGEGEVATDGSTLDRCGNPEFPSGMFNFNGLTKAGLLTDSGEPAPGVTYGFDECTQTSFLYRESDSRMVSYDDTRSLAAKGAFINQQGLAGFAVWHIAADTPTSLLLGSIHKAMGIEELIDCAEGETVLNLPPSDPQSTSPSPTPASSSSVFPAVPEAPTATPTTPSETAPTEPTPACSDMTPPAPAPSESPSSGYEGYY